MGSATRRRRDAAAVGGRNPVVHGRQLAACRQSLVSLGLAGSSSTSAGWNISADCARVLRRHRAVVGWRRWKVLGRRRRTTPVLLCCCRGRVAQPTSKLRAPRPLGPLTSRAGDGFRGGASLLAPAAFGARQDAPERLPSPQRGPTLCDSLATAAAAWWISPALGDCPLQCVLPKHPLHIHSSAAGSMYCMQPSSACPTHALLVLLLHA